MTTKIKIQIKNRWTGSVLFEYEKEDNTIKDTLVEAVKQDADLGGADLGGVYLGGADLGGADLRGADLGGADLGGADLRGADLRDADLGGADLRGADLGGADLRDADLGGADLRDADLRGADLRGADLGGADLGGADLGGVYLGGADLGGADLGDWGKLQDIIIIGPIGSRKAYTTCYKTDKGIYVKCGCFSGTLDEFVAKVKKTHNDNTHERDYLALVEFVKIKFLEGEQ